MPNIDEVLHRCRDSLDELARRLHAEGFPVVEMRTAPPSRDHIREICEPFELPVPLVLVRFWEIVGGIKLNVYPEATHREFLECHGCTGNHMTDALCIDNPSDDEFREYTIRYENDRVEDPNMESVIEISPDSYHKDAYSGAMSYCILAGDDPLEPLVHNFWWVNKRPPQARKSPDFIRYLRQAVLVCAGFPGLYGEPDFEPLRKRLTKGLPRF